MCSIITHSLLGLGIARGGTGQRMPLTYWLAAGILPILPDLDTPIIRLLHPNDPWSVAMRRDSIFSHRGITHSLLFAAATALVAALLVRAPIARWRVWVVLAVATASHPLTDMLTNGGSGIALFAPFWDERFHWPWTPVEVSPLSVSAFFSKRGVEILLNEAVWVLFPLATVLAVIEFLRLRRQQAA